MKDDVTGTAWGSADEIAKARQPGLPSSKRGVAKRAIKEGWRQRPRVARRGGGVEFFVLDFARTDAQREAWARYCARMESGLPAAADLAGAVGSPAADGANLVAAAGTIIAPTDERAARRRYLWELFDRNSTARKKQAAKRAAAATKAVEMINAGWPAMKVYQMVAAECSVSMAALRGWVAAVDGVGGDDFAAVLIDHRSGRARAASYPSRVDDLFRADFLRRDRPSAASCYRRTKIVAEREGLLVPPLITIMRNLKRSVTWQAVCLARQGRERFEASYPAQERDRSDFRAASALQADGFVFDQYVVWPDGAVARPCLCTWIDLYSGLPLSWRVARTENADLVRLSFGDALEYAIPDSVFLDNGRAFAAHWLSGQLPTRFRFKLRAEEPAGIFSLLNVAVHWSIPRHGQAKPIERLHREYRDVSKHPKLAGAMARERAVPLAVFVEVFTAVMEEIRTRPGRRAPNCGGRSFQQTFEEDYARGPVRKATDAQKRLCLLACESVSISRLDGTFRLAGNRFYSREVADLAGEIMVVRFDPEHLVEGPVHVYRPGGEYIGPAACVLPIGFADAAAAREHARLKRQNLRSYKAILANERRMAIGELSSLPLTPPAPASAARSKVVKMFRPAIEGPGGSGSADRTREGVEEEEVADADDMNFARYLRLKAMPADALSESDSKWLLVYTGKPEFVVRRMSGLA